MKERVKILTIALVGVISLSLYSTVKAETITGSYERGNYVKIDGLFQTHDMKLTIDGQSYDVYCAWYENSSPEHNGNYTFESIDIEQKYAVGAASIMNDDVITNGMTSENKRVVKTMALNLYLSMAGVTAGKNCDGSANRFNGSTSWLPDSYKLIHDYSTNLPGMVEQLQNSTNANWKKVYNLYIGAKTISDNYETPYLRFTDSTNDTEFTLSGGYYSKTYQLESNVELVSLTATQEGVEPSQVKIVTSPSNKTVTVKIPKSVYEANPTQIKIIAKAETTLKETKLYVASGADRCKYQDLVITKVGVKNISVTTEDVIETKRCYRYVTKCDSTSCENTNANNIRQCWSEIEEYNSVSCGQDDIANNQSGTRTYDLINGVCSLYCTETATVSYPGNVSPAITLGTNLTWPTTTAGSYPLTTTATQTCKIEMNNGEAVTQNCINAAQNRIYQYINGSGAKIIYNDTRSDKTITLDQKCSTGNSINGTTVTIQNNCSYSLPEDKNIAINKKTVEFVNQVAIEVSNAVTNYILISKYNGVLPICGYSWTDSSAFSSVFFDKYYNLQIADLPLGYQNQFATQLNKSEYVCNYQVTKDIGGSCACPPGTVLSGQNLYDFMKGEAKTCAEAQELYCSQAICIRPDGSKADIASCLENDDLETCKALNGCIDSPNLCPSDSPHPERSYKSCVYGGKTADECIQEVCYDPCEESNCEYKCPRDSDYPGMDISSCVLRKRAEGLTLQQALNSCQTLCDIGGKIIIYRTISLENPFPSMDADMRVTQSGLSLGMFNDTVKGRYPGSNWNSSTLVHNKILNNRGYDGSAIYQEATPLYTINLDANAIKKIREYNKKQEEQNKGGYADFELKCTDGAYCISSFLHDNTITTATGTPILDYQNSTCANAHDKNSFISCYTYK